VEVERRPANVRAGDADVVSASQSADRHQALAMVLLIGSLLLSVLLWVAAWMVWDRRGGSTRTAMLSVGLEGAAFLAASAGAALTRRHRTMSWAAVALSAGVFGSGVFVLATIWRYRG
jgi:uncharacterized membrane protein